MKLKLKFISMAIATIMTFSICFFAGCDLFFPDETGGNPSETLIATLNSETISDFYASGTTIYTTAKGRVTLSLKDDRTSTGFKWSLSNCSLKKSAKYSLKFTYLNISGFSPTTPNNAALELYWVDSSYPYFQYFSKQYNSFISQINYPDNYLYLTSLDYDLYEINFQFSHYAIDNATNKNMYFNLTGIAPNGIVSFSSLSIYEIKS